MDAKILSHLNLTTTLEEKVQYYCQLHEIMRHAVIMATGQLKWNLSHPKRY